MLPPESNNQNANNIDRSKRCVEFAENQQKGPSTKEAPKFHPTNSQQNFAQGKSYDLNLSSYQPKVPKQEKINANASEKQVEFKISSNPSLNSQQVSFEHKYIGQQNKEKYQQTSQLIKEISMLLVQNPIICSIIAAVIVSVSGLREFLDPECKKFVLCISWIESSLRALGACLTPLALVVTGLWISNNKIFKSCNVCTIIFDLIFKFLVIPVVMIPIGMLLGLHGDVAKASVILSTMPVALVAVPMAQQYNVAVNDFTINLVLGLILMFPCILALMEFMEHFGWFNA